MGGHHDVKLPEVPCWKVYKVEDSPELMKVKKTLEARGLCYPWLRNEVWKFKKSDVSNVRQALKYTFGGGFKYGLAAAIITIVVDKLYTSLTEKSHGGAHEEHH